MRTNDTVLNELAFLSALLGNFPAQVVFPERLDREQLNGLISAMLNSGTFVLVNSKAMPRGSNDFGEDFIYFNKKFQSFGDFTAVVIHAGDGFLRITNDYGLRYIDMLAALVSKKELLTYRN